LISRGQYRESRDIARSDLPIREGEISEKTVGVRTPEWELEEHRLFGPWIVKVLVERPPAEGWVAIKWYQS
jgi:hypothetical protein